MSPATDNPARLQPLREALFADPELRAYAVLDGASVPRLPQALWEHQPQHVCLYAGELKPDLAEAAPYLVAMMPDHSFTEWVLKEGWGKHWGVLAAAPAGVQFRELRRHFRQFLMVKDPSGKPLYFRYYDPRVLVVFMPTCDADQLRFIFGPLTFYLAEQDHASAACRFRLRGGQLWKEDLAFEAPQIVIEPAPLQHAASGRQEAGSC